MANHKRQQGAVQAQREEKRKPYSERERRSSSECANNIKDDTDPGNMSPQSKRRHQSRLSSARLRERQRQRITSVEKEVSDLESYVKRLQNSIHQYKRRGGEIGSPGSQGPKGGTLSDDTTGGDEIHQQPIVRLTDAEVDLQDFEMQVRQLVMSMNVAAGQLDFCSERIDMLKGMLLRNIGAAKSTAAGDETDMADGSDLPMLDASMLPSLQRGNNTFGHREWAGAPGFGFESATDVDTVYRSSSVNNSTSGSNTVGGSQYEATGSPTKQQAKTGGISRIPVAFLLEEFGDRPHYKVAPN
ncbi:hypothetical protein GGI07_002994 [Coemansia sp. Benny D115]|nr:hypothetical protein GGI07_002994 [Coemansia sp. Benny D115]